MFRANWKLSFETFGLKIYFCDVHFKGINIVELCIITLKSKVVETETLQDSIIIMFSGPRLSETHNICSCLAQDKSEQKLPGPRLFLSLANL